MPRADSEAMTAHLEEISKSVASGAYAIMVCDQAGWHQSGKLDIPDNISLLPLPPYSPELNPMENVWEYLRKNKLAITTWDTFEEIMDACCEAWNFFANDKSSVKSITQRNYAKAVSD